MLNCLKRFFKDWTPQKPRWLLGGLGAVLILVPVVLSWVGWISWGWTQAVWKWLSGEESGSTTIRNLGLVIGGFIAIWLALRRIRVAQRGLMNERYQKATEMLGSDVLTVRLGGIYALQRLADEDPEQYHVQIMRLFCAFVRNPVTDEAEKLQEKPVREDVQAIMDAIATRSDADIELEKKADDFRPDLRSAYLSGGFFRKGNLSNAILAEASLNGAILTDADLTDADLFGAELRNANLSDANLSGASLASPAGLLQSQLDQACADPENPPKLEGALDAETKEPLVWNERPC